MLAKCANPQCSTRFQYLGDGRLFKVELDENGEPCRPGATAKFRVVRVERFWLCATCAAGLTLKYEPALGFCLEPVAAQTRRAAAS
jgi:hypothetical protein